MKFLPVTLAGLALWCACVGADDRVPGKARAAQQALGEQFVASLRDDNIVAYSQCWLSGAIISRSECDAAEPDEEHLAWLRNSLPARDLEIARQFEFLRDRLKDLAGSVSSVKLESVRLDPRDAEDVTLETSNTLYLAPALGIVLRVDPDTLVEISVEGATGTADRWWLTRSAGEMGALRITRRGKARFVNIMTAKEQFLFSIPPFTIKRRARTTTSGRPPTEQRLRTGTAGDGRRRPSLPRRPARAVAPRRQPRRLRAVLGIGQGPAAPGRREGRQKRPFRPRETLRRTRGPGRANITTVRPPARQVQGTDKGPLLAQDRIRLGGADEFRRADRLSARVPGNGGHNLARAPFRRPGGQGHRGRDPSGQRPRGEVRRLLVLHRRSRTRS